jgi:ATP-dependent DNA helicase RecG
MQSMPHKTIHFIQSVRIDNSQKYLAFVFAVQKDPKTQTIRPDIFASYQVDVVYNSAMRHAMLFPLFATTATLSGVGSRLAKLLERLAIRTVIELLWHLPLDVLDRSERPTIMAAAAGSVVTLQVKIAEHVPPSSPRLPYRIIAFDPTGQITLSFFNGKSRYLTEQYPSNTELLISGRVERYRQELQMPHPDFVVPLAEAATIPQHEAIYGLTEGISNKMLRRFIAAALAKLPALPEWSDLPLVAARQWPAWQSAMQVVHQPHAVADCLPDHPARQRLAYDELLANQLAMHVVRRHHRQRPGRALPATGRLTQALLAMLPFQLTGAQQQAWQEIAADLTAAQPMTRLLQGDVGSGKTIVAVLAMLQAVEAGTQAALLAPTEILAKQHYAKLRPLLQSIGVDLGLLIGKAPAKDKQAVAANLAAGRLPLVIGTHALIQDSVAFHDLGLVVVDEQHRFGVQQRAQLAEKGQGSQGDKSVALLAMTATPIPRTLTLTAYGDMDVSVLDSKPPGRQPIDTRVIDLTRLDEVIAGLRRAISAGRQAYWVCPLVHESAVSDLANATARAAMLAEQLHPAAVGLIHGQMPAAERDAVMARFVAGEVQLLVATTVIEVGVDVPNATLMLIEHAERFGLAQLHQLRGRVGRGAEHSSCVLLYQAPLGENATARLRLLRETEDGFRLAEEDLRLRGAGDILGTKQSGLLEYRLADLSTQADLLRIARDDAALALQRDPLLQTPRGQALRLLLSLFNYDRATHYLRSG